MPFDFQVQRVERDSDVLHEKEQGGYEANQGSAEEDLHQEVQPDLEDQAGKE